MADCLPKPLKHKTLPLTSKYDNDKDGGDDGTLCGNNGNNDDNDGGGDNYNCMQWCVVSASILPLTSKNHLTLEGKILFGR